MLIFPLCGLFWEFGRVVVILCVALCCVFRCVVCYVLRALLGMELELRGSSNNVGTIECVVVYCVVLYVVLIDQTCAFRQFLVVGSSGQRVQPARHRQHPVGSVTCRYRHMSCLCVFCSSSVCSQVRLTCPDPISM